jgi:hypothetical protein
MALPTRAQKRWSPRLRMAGALLLLAGAVAVADRLLPGTRDLSLWVQVCVGAALAAVGAIFFFVGRKWR